MTVFKQLGSPSVVNREQGADANADDEAETECGAGDCVRAMAARPPLRAEFTTYIDRSPDEVWAVVSDIARTPAWRTTVKEVDAPPAGQIDVGATLTATTKVLARRWSWTLRITEFQPSRRLRYETVEGAADMATEYRCEPEGEGCRFTLIGSSAGTDSAIIRLLLTPLLVPSLTREARKHVQNLKRPVEN